MDPVVGRLLELEMIIKVSSSSIKKTSSSNTYKVCNKVNITFVLTGGTGDRHFIKDLFTGDNPDPEEIAESEDSCLTLNTSLDG